MLRQFAVVLGIVLTLPSAVASAAPIPSDLKKCVVFLYVNAEDVNAKARGVAPYGTGFMVGVKSSTDANKMYAYMVTAKHVLETGTENGDAGTPLKRIYVRLNRRDGQISKPLELDLRWNGQDRNVFVDDDPTVDIAVVPIAPSEAIFDYKVLPFEMVTSKKDISDLQIGEGTDIFFAGLFSPYQGERRIFPIVRFGKVALLTDEEVPWGKGQKTDLYLVDTGSFGGNSGSPVFFFLGADRTPGALTLGFDIRLAGVMKGSFLDHYPVALVQQSIRAYSAENMGIAAVVPAYRLREILLSADLATHR
jgi:hypothetical protein